MTFALFFGRMQNVGFWVNMVDVAPESAATVMGISNTFATIPGIAGQPITQAILDSSGSWAIVFGVGGLIGIVASCVFLALGDDVPLDQSSLPHSCTHMDVCDATLVGIPIAPGDGDPNSDHRPNAGLGKSGSN